MAVHGGMLLRILPFVAAVFFAPPAPVGTQGPPPGWKPPPPPAPDQIYGGPGEANVLDVTPKVKQDLEARPDYQKLRIVLRHGATDAELANLVAKLPWVEHLIFDEPVKVTSLAPIAKLTKLRALHINTNAVKTIAPLAKHPSLEALTVTCSKDFTDKDLTAIADVTTLRTIDLRNCTTLGGSLHGLEKLTELQAVSTYGMPIASLAPLAGHTKIAALFLHDNVISDLSPVAGMPNLATLNLSGAKATSFDAFRGLTKLSSVDLSKTNITSLDVFAASSSMWSVTVNDAKSLTLANLPSWPKITMLYIGGTNIADLTPLTKLGSLQYISFDQTPVTTIAPLLGMPNLKSVHMPTVISDQEVIALEKSHPGIGVLRFGKPLPGRPPSVPIP